MIHRAPADGYCEEGVKALKDNGVQGLLGLYGAESASLNSYSTPDESALAAKAGKVI